MLRRRQSVPRPAVGGGMLTLLRLPREPPKHARIPAVPLAAALCWRLRYALLL